MSPLSAIVFVQATTPDQLVASRWLALNVKSQDLQGHYVDDYFTEFCPRVFAKFYEKNFMDINR